jgi:malate dehydrogenase (oxaloacetate-decarboxylating)(NADP+)
VAEAAMESGVARTPIDLDEYRDRLMASLGPGREVMRQMTERARRKPKRVVLCEGHNDRVIRAAAQILEEGVAQPILMGRPPRVHEKAAALGVDLTGVEIVYAAQEHEAREQYAKELFERRRRKGLTMAEARFEMFQPTYFAGMMVHTGRADAMVAGIESNYPEILRPALQVVGREPGLNRVAGLYVVALSDQRVLFFADTTVNIDPDASALADIARLAARFVKKLGIEPKIAMISFSNFGSARHPTSDKVREAVGLVKAADPTLQIDGEMQVDTAVSKEILKHSYPFTEFDGTANVLIFPGLSAANSAYKLLSHLGGAEVIGPVLLGMDHPVHILQRGSTVQEVLNLVTIASVDAQLRAGQV